jgi:hypothetical protein
MFLWSIAWGVIGGVVALAILWGAITNPTSFTTNLGAFILTLFLTVLVSTLVASVGIFATIFKVTAEGTIEQIGISSVSPITSRAGTGPQTVSTAQHGYVTTSVPVERLFSNEVSKYFTFCPLCSAKDSVNISFAGNFILCAMCGSKWEVRPRNPAGEIDWLKLVTVGTDAEGTSLVNKVGWLHPGLDIGQKRNPEFWRQKALEGQRTALKSEDGTQ